MKKSRTPKFYKNFISAISSLTRRLPVIGKNISPPTGYYTTTSEFIDGLKSVDADISCDYKELYPACALTRKIPKTIDETVHAEFKNNLELNLPAYFVAEFNKGSLIGKNAAVITPDNKVLTDLIPGMNIEGDSIFKKNKPLFIKKSRENIAVLTTSFGTGYYHWFFDVLPRFKCLNDKNIDKYLINDLKYPFQFETLKLFGIPVEKMMTTSSKLHLRPEKLTVPSFPYMNKWCCEYLREKVLLPEVLDQEIETYERIYISRASSPKRKILNEEAILKVLEPLGFKKIMAETLSFSHQVKLFNSAKVIVAPHGAGLTNLVFSNPNTKVIEVFSPNYVVGCYWILSNFVDLDYYYLMGEGERPDNHRISDGNITVDPQKLSQLLELAGVR